jgi:O-antigen/teichoic acid export membrane protein
MATWLMFIIPASIAAVAVGEALIPLYLADQDEATRGLARAYMPVLAAILVGDVGIAILLGSRRYGFYNICRLITPVGSLAAYSGLEYLHSLTVTNALMVTGVLTVASYFLPLAVSVASHGLAQPGWVRGKYTLWYGFRAHGTNVSQLVNLRLDSLVLPAFVTAPNLGLYSVAVSASGLILSLTTPLAILVLPDAAARARGQPVVVLTVAWASIAIGAALAILLGVFAEPAVTAVYGTSFAPSIAPLRVLLPGSVMYVGAYCVWQGLYAAGRPFTAFIGQLIGAIATVAGLFLALPRGGGILSAALISSASYALVLISSVALYCRTMRMHPRSLFIPAHWKSVVGPPHSFIVTRQNADE